MNGSSEPSRATVWRRGPLPARRIGRVFAAFGILAASGGGIGAVRAETLPGALVKSYKANPTLNAQRATTRAADENVPIANSGYLPHAVATGDVGYLHNEFSSPGSSAGGLGGFGGAGGGGGVGGTTRSTTDTVPRGVGVQVTQTLFDGFRTSNSIKQAESNVFGQRETLRNVEQSVLQSAAQSYMDVLRDTAVLELRNSNIKVLEEQLRQTQDRFKVGEVTRTDVAQGEAGLAGSRADYYTAQANLQNSIASFRQVVGEQPTRLEPAKPIEKGVPTSLAAAITISQVEHPNVQAALHNVDTAELQVKIAEGVLYPTIGVTGSLAQRYDYSATSGANLFNASVVGSISVPIYDGSAPYAQVRQAKENLSQARLNADVVREQVRAAVISAYGLLESSKIVVQSDQAQVNASGIALNGVREEARVGQRTTLDVLNAQQTLLNARVALVGAQRDRVVASYAVLATIGRLSTTRLGLRVTPYNPVVHFDQVKDKWFGLRTPDGK